VLEGSGPERRGEKKEIAGRERGRGSAHAKRNSLAKGEKKPNSWEVKIAPFERGKGGDDSYKRHTLHHLGGGGGGRVGKGGRRFGGGKKKR